MHLLYFKIAIRHLFKNKMYAFINIFGLSVGVASFLLIMLYVNYERSYDTFKDSDRVYRVYMDYTEGDRFVPGDAQTYIVSGPTLHEEFPEIQQFVRMRHGTGVVFMKDNQVFKDNTGAMTDPSYFEVFGRSLARGDEATALVEPFSIVLTKSLARKIFGDKDPLGKTLQIYGGSKPLLTVTGIMDDVGENTHIKTSYLMSLSSFYKWDIFSQQWDVTWNQNNYFTYIKLDQNADPASVQKKIMGYKVEALPYERHNMEPIEDIHLYSNKPYEAEANGNANSVRFLTIIAFITILLSWLNYINLSTTKSLERAKEIGIRKVAGAKKTQLVLQSLFESAVLNIAAVGIALALTFIFLPAFNSFVGHELSFELMQATDLLLMAGILILGTVLAALYPAFVLSSYRPSRALKGKIQVSSSGLNIRKALIVGQFLATISLLVGTFVANKQIRFIRNQPIGANLNNLVALDGQILETSSDSIIQLKRETLKSELLKNPMVSGVSMVETYPGEDEINLSSSVGITFPNGLTDDKRIWYNYGVDNAYFDLLEMEFAAGGPFRRAQPDGIQQVVINERFARHMGITDFEGLVGQNLQFFGEKWEVSGVLKDYHHLGLKKAIEPLLIRPILRNTNTLLVKLNQEASSLKATEEAIERFRDTWYEVFPESSFDFSFLDKQFEAQYQEDVKFNTAFLIFTVLAIVIASLGLFGLTSYSCLQRRKEIGVRKVNGASTSQVLQLLNRDLVRWVGIAFVLSIPLSWFAMSKWLESFAYKTEINWWIFGLSGLTALMIALATVSWQSFKTASLNPADTLRDE